MAAALSFAASPSLARSPGDTTIITATNHAPGSTTRSTEVATADLDLTKLADQRRLTARIEQAADAVCAVGADEVWNRNQSTDYHRCFNNAFENAMWRVRRTEYSSLN